ncbi:MAG: Ig-like domain-containing protein [bacterium]|nr:Ig-like domain-containing protein [bacterium]
MPGLAAAALAGACVAGTEPPVPASIEVSPPSATLPWFDETVQLTATVLDTAGRTLPGVTVAWTSEDALVATVDATGLVTAVAAGVTFVRAGTGSVEGSATVTVAPDRRALLILYDALGGSGWLESENWGTDAPLDEWHGVAADSKDNVLALELSNNGLSGTIPPEIGALGALQELQLGSWLDALTGEIPPGIGNLDNLRYLHLWGFDLTGAIPPEIGNLQNLRYLHLWGGDLTGAIPPEIGNLQNLRYLHLWGGDLTDAIPPELGNLQNLRYLDLSGDLTGAIPPELGSLRNLQGLYLYYNELTGAIPPELGTHLPV